MRLVYKIFNPAELFIAVRQFLEGKKLATGLVCLLLVFMTLTGCGGAVLEPSQKPVQQTTKPAPKATDKELIPPELGLLLNAGALSQTGLEVKIEAIVNNPNADTINIDSLEVNAKSEKGQTYIQDAIPGNSIAPNSSATFVKNLMMPLDVLTERIIVTVSTNFVSGGITIPLSATFRMPDLRRLISNPGINLTFNFGQLTVDGLNSKLEVKVNNPNLLRLDVGMLKVLVNGHTNEVLTTSTLTGGPVSPNSTYVFTGDITFPPQFLNETRATATVDAMAGIGPTTLPLKSTTTLKLPKLAQLITAPKITIDTDQYNETEYKFLAVHPIPKLQLLVKASVVNDNDIAITIANMRVNIFKPDGNVVKSISSTTRMTVPVRSTRTFSPGWITIGENTIGIVDRPVDLALAGLIGNDLTIRFDMEVGIERVYERVPISATYVFPLKP